MCDDSRMLADQSVSVGLVATELVINILKYGFSRVEANGAGMPEPLAKVNREQALSKRLQASSTP